MKISVVIPIHNEDKTIKDLYSSLKWQSKKPAEIIFVEDSSIDKSYKLLRELKRKDKKVKILRTNFRNISKNRNLGIRRAISPWVACIDAGCTINEKYLENFSKAVKKNRKVYFFGAVTKIPYRNKFEQAYSLMLERMPNKYYLPKGHAFFINKSLWKRLNGFDEKILAAEDTHFILRSKKLGFSPKIVKNNFVYWKPRKNYKEIRKQFFNYGYWDGRKFGLLKSPKKSIFNILFTIIFPLAIFYSAFFSILKARKISVALILFFMNLVKMYSYSIGYIWGLFK